MKTSLILLNCLLAITQSIAQQNFEWCNAPNREHPTGVQVSNAPDGCAGYCRSYWKKDGGFCIKGDEFQRDGRTLTCVCNFKNYVTMPQIQNKHKATTQRTHKKYEVADVTHKSSDIRVPSRKLTNSGAKKSGHRYEPDFSILSGAAQAQKPSTNRVPTIKVSNYGVKNPGQKSGPSMSISADATKAQKLSTNRVPTIRVTNSGAKSPGQRLGSNLSISAGSAEAQKPSINIILLK